MRPLLLGASIGPYRLFGPADSVLPVDGEELLTATSARARGYRHLARWLDEAEAVWAAHEGQGLIAERLDYLHQLSAQLPISSIRVLYAASGTNPAACVCTDDTAIVEHKLYWSAFETLQEARYLCCILNSDTARDRVAHLQSRGQWGARDFDKVMFELPIPKFDPVDTLHTDLVDAASRAEAVATATVVTEVNFVAGRTRIRRALAADGVAAEIESLVRQLLP